MDNYELTYGMVHLYDQIYAELDRLKKSTATIASARLLCKKLSALLTKAKDTLDENTFARITDDVAIELFDKTKEAIQRELMFLKGEQKESYSDAILSLATQIYEEEMNSLQMSPSFKKLYIDEIYRTKSTQDAIREHVQSSTLDCGASLIIVGVGAMIGCIICSITDLSGEGGTSNIPYGLILGSIFGGMLAGIIRWFKERFA